MKIAHEAPLAIMPEVRSITDYDYALVHLFEDQGIGQKYFEFFKKSLALGRGVILDNSIFELGESFNSEKFLGWIKKLNPSEYIIPDVLESFEGTREKSERWWDLVYNSCGNCCEIPPSTVSIGVVQGKNLDEAIKCYEYWSENDDCNKIAISFDYSFYLDFCPHLLKVYSFMYGRQYFIDLLVKEGIINRKKPHHLLGVALPQEILHYRDKKYNFIESIDTSNPVVHGFMCQSYEEYGLDHKESKPLYKLINEEIDWTRFNIIVDNIRKFRSFANGY